jgi:hypothetical protein
VERLCNSKWDLDVIVNTEKIIDVEGSDHGLFQALFVYASGDMEENVNDSARVACNLAKVQTGCLLDTSPNH